MKIKKIGLLLIMFVLMSFAMTGCGAKINTTLTISKDFSGQRKIDVIIENEDLSENVTGGINALKSTADSNIPKEMTYTVSPSGDKTMLTFIIEFQDLDDYRTKVASIISYGSNKELTPEITYENLDTVFKKGVKLKENFTSFDLLQWYFDAIKKANIVSHSDTSEWYELGDNVVDIDGVKYENSSKLSIDEQELSCLSGIDVKTILNLDGTITREIVFKAYDTTLETLSNNGCEFGSYISKLVPEGDAFEQKKTDSLNEYIITINAVDTNELVQKTNKILQTSNDFTAEVAVNPETLGHATISLSEKIDGSFYLDYQSNSPLQSTIELYDNCSLNEQNDVYITNDKLQYYPAAVNSYSFKLDWQISFASVEIISNIKSDKKASVDIVFTSEETLQEELKTSAVDALKAFCNDVGKLSENGDVTTIAFSGSIDELKNDINEFVKSADTIKDKGKTYFDISFNKTETLSNFKNGYVGNITYDLSPIIGKTNVKFNDIDSFLTDYYYQGNFIVDNEGNKLAESQDTISFSLVKVSVIIVVLFFLSCVVVVLGIVLLIRDRKKIISLIAYLKDRNQKPVVDKKVLDSEIKEKHPIMATTTNETSTQIDDEEIL